MAIPVSLSIADFAEINTGTCESESSHKSGRNGRFGLDIILAYSRACDLNG